MPAIVATPVAFDCHSRAQVNNSQRPYHLSTVLAIAAVIAVVVPIFFRQFQAIVVKSSVTAETELGSLKNAMFRADLANFAFFALPSKTRSQFDIQVGFSTGSVIVRIAG